MGKILIISLIIVNLAGFISTGQEWADDEKTTEPAITIESRELDSRAEILAAYFAQYNSPLEYHAQDFIDAADSYNVDWRLVPAISGVESTFGKFIPGGYNAWGWGVYGTHALYFNSWRDGIFTVTEGLKKNYIDKGLTDPYSMNRIYAASPYWGGKVSYFLQNISNFATSAKLSLHVI